MRGLATVHILKQLHHLSGLNLNDFDIICGTSAGGLIALASLLGLNLDQIESLFLQIGKTVFTSSWANTARYYAGTSASVIFGKKAGGKYSTNAYEACLFEALEQYGDPNRTLAELGQGKPAVFAVASDVSFDSCIRPFIMRSYEHPEHESQKTLYEAVPDGTSAMPLVQAALATSAAPTYFDSHIQWEDPTTRVKTRLVDGGLGFNNPIFLGIHELKRTFGWDTEVELVVSIGTGKPVLKLAVEDKSVMGWGTTVVNIATEGEFVHNNFQLTRPLLAGFTDAIYARFNPEDLGGHPMDDPSEKALDQIRALAADHMRKAPAKSKTNQIRHLLRQHRQQNSDRTDV